MVAHGHVDQLHPHTAIQNMGKYSVKIHVGLARYEHISFGQSESW
jgi:hypothetical protein